MASKATELINGETGTMLFRLIVPSFLALLMFTYNTDGKRRDEALAAQSERLASVEAASDLLNGRLLEMLGNLNLGIAELRASNNAQDAVLEILGERLLDHEDRVRILERQGTTNVPANGPFPGVGGDNG